MAKDSKEEVLENEEVNEQPVEETESEENVEENSTEESTSDENVDESSQEEVVEEKELSKEEQTFKVQLQRLQAEFMNYKKRVEREKIELSSFVKGEFVKRFLPVLDDINRVQTNLESDEKTIKDALGMVFKKVDEFVEKEKIEKVGVEGEAFDPNLHEALMQVPTDDEAQDETIAQVFEQGYKVGEKIVRFAKVQVYQKQ